MFEGLRGIAADLQPVALTLYTDAYVIRGTVMTRQRRVSDVLNEAENDFLVLTEVILDEYGSRELAHRTDYAQVNLGTVLFAVADTAIEPAPELRTPKVREQALVSIPPFRITGRIHLLPERHLREALEELVGRFLPVTDATYWSDVVGEARRTAPMVAVNHARAQILAPHREVDPWEGLDRSAADRAPDALGDVPVSAASTSRPAGQPDPWATPAAPAAGGPHPGSAERQGPAANEPSNPWGGPGGDPWSPGRPAREDEPLR